LPTRAGSPQQHMPITVGPFYLTHPVNFPCGRKPEYPGETHDFRQSVDFLLFSHEDWVRVALRKYLVRFEPSASEVKGKCANHLATEAPCIVISFPVHYSIDLQLLIGCNIGFPLYFKPLQCRTLNFCFELTSPN
jgi:hypothetical protein